MSYDVPDALLKSIQMFVTEIQMRDKSNPITAHSEAQNILCRQLTDYMFGIHIVVGMCYHNVGVHRYYSFHP